VRNPLSPTPDASGGSLGIGVGGPQKPRYGQAAATADARASISVHRTWLPRVGLAAACAVGLIAGGIGLTDEGYGSLNGDMARYLMNGVFVRDLLVDRPFGSFSDLLEYTRLYYARYPALSLGHHPVLLPVLEAPLFAVFGISVTAARLVPLTALLAAILCLYGIVSRRYGPLAAVGAAALLATSPMVIGSTRAVMAEMPAIALLLACAYSLERFYETESRWALVASAAAAILSVYAKPHAVLVAITALPIRRLLKRDVLLTAAAVTILGAPAVVGPLMFSPINAVGAMQAVRFESRSSTLTLLSTALGPQLAWPVLVVAAAGALRAVVQRNPRAILFVVWVVGVTPAAYLFSAAPGTGPRYTLFWVPALCALAGSMLAPWRTRWAPAAVAAVLAVGLGMQVDDAFGDVGIGQAGGYEEAAQFVVASNPGPTVLFSGDVDTGYFVFFVRKHDPSRRLVVLRSDKVFTTSRMERVSVEDRIERPEQIYPVLRQFGTRYVVIEDRPSQSRVLESLRQELKSSKFIERRRIPIRTRDARLRRRSLVIYELVEPSPPDGNAVLSLNMPVVGQSLALPLRDLLDRKLLR
jgi:hypothetical protein